jgi:hypothetical protein
MSGKRLDSQEQHDVAPSARKRAADKTADTARTENRMSHTRDRKRRSRANPRSPALPLALLTGHGSISAVITRVTTTVVSKLLPPLSAGNSTLAMTKVRQTASARTPRNARKA